MKYHNDYMLNTPSEEIEERIGEELAIEKGKLPTQVQVPSSNLAVGGICY